MRRRTIQAMMLWTVSLLLAAYLNHSLADTPQDERDPDEWRDDVTKPKGGLNTYGTAVLVWDPVIHPDLGGYKIWIGTQSGYVGGHIPGDPPEGVERDYSSFVAIDVQNVTTYSYAGLDKRIRYYFVATAYSVPRGDPPVVDESDFSNEVHTDWKNPKKPLNLQWKENP